MQQTTIIDPASLASPGDTETTKLIREKRRELGRHQVQVDRANDWQISWLAAAAIAGCATVLLSWILGDRSTDLGVAKDELNALEIRQVEENGAVEVARVGGDAKATAEQIKSDAARVKQEADLKIADLEQQAAAANKEAAKASEGLALANLAIENRKMENLQLSSKLEEEQIRRAALVESVLWRNGRIYLGDWWRAKNDENWKEAKRLNPDNPQAPDVPVIDVSIVCAREREPMWVAHELAVSLPAGAVFRISELSFDDNLQSGITVRLRVGPSDAGDFRYEAVDAIIEALRRNFVTAGRLPARLPDNTLRIEVGLSDRLTGPMVWRRGDDFATGAPPREVPPPIQLIDADGNLKEFHFDAPPEQATAPDQSQQE